MTKFIAWAGHGRSGRHPLALALAAALTLAEPCSGKPVRDSPLFAMTPPAEARLANRLGSRVSGALRERHPRTADRPAGMIVVDNCNDTGSGSLRDAMAGAVSGDVIDVSQLTCSTITLGSGGIITNVDDLELVGPGAGALTIDAAYNGRAFYHLGYGTFVIGGMTITHGTYSGGPYYHALGGCVLSLSDIEINDSVITGCSVTDTFTDAYGSGGGGVLAFGSVMATGSSINACTATSTSEDIVAAGGIFAAGDITLVRSTVSGNTATSGIVKSYGGGAVTIQDLTMKYSTVRDNEVSTYAGLAGGVYVQGDVYLFGSTISGNHAAAGGGMWLNGEGALYPAKIINSTISGNVAEAAVGGIVSDFPMVLSNSTIAFNSSALLNVGGIYIADDTELQSSIISSNSAGATQRDLGGDVFASITGANNLVGVTFLTVPADTISADPLLGPLSQNGGFTQTHALLSGSPAIDTGNNALNLERDQRGLGFPRVIGANADIGAFEADADRIFADSFEH